MASDAELIAQSLAGDQAAFAEMISRHEGAIGRFLVRQVGVDAAADVQGDVWIAAYTLRTKYDQSYSDARPWLYGVALNEVRRWWRSTPREDLMADVSQIPGLWNPWPTVETRVAAREALRNALAALKPSERDVLALVAGEDMAITDAARVLGIPAGSARRLLHQARTALRADPQVAALLAELNNNEGRE